MIDVSTKQQLRVETDAKAGSYLELPASQLDQLQEVLDRRGIQYWIDDNLISFDDGPEMAWVNFGRKGDPQAIQAALDSAA